MSPLSLTSLAGRINREHEAALRDAGSAIEHARTAGKLLLEAREQCEGKWLDWLAENCSQVAERTAQKYMQIGRHPALEAKSIGEALLKIAAPRRPNNPPGRAPAQATEYKRNVSQNQGKRPFPHEAQEEAERRAAVVDLPKSEQLAAAKGKAANPEPDEPERPEWEPDEDAKLEAIQREVERSIDRVMQADDKLAEARIVLELRAAEIVGLKASRDHFQTEVGIAARLVKARDRKIEKLSKALAKAQEENEALRERIAIAEAA